MGDLHEQHATRRECFLCTLDPKGPCNEVQLEGRIVAAQERIIDGEKTSVISLDTGTSHVELYLDDHYYHGLIREINARENLIANHHLILRVYHLPNAPSIVEGEARRSYKANTYTLAVLQPDVLLNITDLNRAEYCPRQYLLYRLSPSSMSAAAIRGNLVHYCFKELLKEHGRFDTQRTQARQETARETLNRYLEQALSLNSIDMALAHVSLDTMRGDVAPHLESLACWYESERNTLWDLPTHYVERQADEEIDRKNQVRAETFLLAPEIGLRGRLDLFWQQSGRQRLLELKTGGAHGTLPKREHRWQVYGYHALLMVRRDSKMKRALATLLYSGTPGSAQAFGIPASIREIQRVNETRNVLVISHVTGTPSPPPGPSRCTKCAMLTECQDVSSLLQWQPPEPDMSMQRPADIAMNTRQTTRAQSGSVDIAEDRAFFTKYYQLLHIEGNAGEQQQSLLWKTPVAERLERGTALQELEAQEAPIVDKDGWQQTFRCANTSELREGDEVLLSDGNPITGEVVTGTIIGISSEHVTVWTQELITRPSLIDRYDNNLVHVRTLQNLLRWLQAEPHLRDLVAGKIRPRFIDKSIIGRADFNVEQNLAVERAMQMQDYLLIHGPPGTGKTSVIAEIVKRLCQEGQRVLLAAFTNQAVDNMLKRLDKEGLYEYLRLGHERSVDDLVKHRLLKSLVEMRYAETVTGVEQCMPTYSVHYAQLVQEVLQTMPIVAATTATWSSDKYNPRAADEAGLDFDVAIIDEAGQLTVPAILGALRFTKRFILVGDEKQLPPLVLSKEAAENGLAHSLFSSLRAIDTDYLYNHSLSISACVPLRTQYRMNKWISNFSSTVFYEKQLAAHASVANRKLVLTPPKHITTEIPPWVARAIDPAFPLVFLDVRDESANGASKISNAEARAVRDVVAGLLTCGIEQQDIGVIAPYRAQVANIRRHLFSTVSGWQALPADSPLSVDTVDRFQGGERSVIIMSFATTTEPESQRREFLINPNRLNVALTRAQRKLILVGCVPALEHLPIFSRLITYCQSMKTLIAHTDTRYNSAE